MKRLVPFKRLDDLVFPLIENICKPRKLPHSEVTSLFVAKCEGCGAGLEGQALAMQAAAILMGQVPRGCPTCGHANLVADLIGLSTGEEARLGRDRFFATLTEPNRIIGQPSPKKWWQFWRHE